MVKDPEFYSLVIKQDPGKFDENDPALLKGMIDSQNKQCVRLYGGEAKITKAELPTPTSGARGGGRGGSRAVAEARPIAKESEDENLLSKFLCEEDFPKKFVDPDTIKNILAPDLKEEAEIKGLKHTEAIITKWAYCSGDNVTELPDGGVTIDLGLKSEEPEPLPPLSKFLNLSLNPRSDLDSLGDKKISKDNDYAKFNNSVCNFVPEKCKDLNASYADFDCSTSNMAANTAKNLVNLAGKGQADLMAKFDDLKVTDKELRSSLRGAGKFTEDQIDAILLLRNQTTQAKLARAKNDLKNLLSKRSPPVDMDEYIKLKGGLDNVLSEPGIPKELKRRIRDADMGYLRDNVYSESLEDQKSSLFSNYFALGNDQDRAALDGRGGLPTSGNLGTNNPPSNSTTPDSGRAIASTGNASTGNTSSVSSGSNRPTTQDEEAPIYKRRTFKNFQEPTYTSTDIPAVRSLIETEPAKPEPAKPAEKPAEAAKPQPNEPAKKVGSAEEAKPVDTVTTNQLVSETTQVVRPKGQDSNNSSNNGIVLSGSGGGAGGSSGGKKSEGDGDNLTTRQLEDRLKKLNEMVEDKARSNSGGVNGQDGSSASSEINELKDQIAQEKRRIANSIRNNAYSDASSRTGSGGNSFGSNGYNSDSFSRNNSGANNKADNGNQANAYDPLDRATTGRRDIKDVKEVNNSATEAEDENAAGAGGTGSSKTPKKALVGSSGTTKGGAVGAGALGEMVNGDIRKGSRYPAQENGENDPDDICGYEQEMACYFEFASIDVLSPSLQRFVEYLQLQGRSFKALEVYKYKNKKQPTRYFVHVYEPAKNMTVEEKKALYEKVKKLSLDYKKNRVELKRIASEVVEVNKIEISKQEVKDLSKNILRLPDLNKLSARRARNQ